LQAGRLGERFISPSGSGRCPAAKRLVNIRLKISPLVATIFRSFPGNETSNWEGLGGRVVTYFCKQTVWTSQWHGRRLAKMWRRVWVVLNCIYIFAWALGGQLPPCPPLMTPLFLAHWAEQIRPHRWAANTCPSQSERYEIR